MAVLLQRAWKQTSFVNGNAQCRTKGKLEFAAYILPFPSAPRRCKILCPLPSCSLKPHTRSNLHAPYSHAPSASSLFPGPFHTTPSAALNCFSPAPPSFLPDPFRPSPRRLLPGHNPDARRQPPLTASCPTAPEARGPPQGAAPTA